LSLPSQKSDESADLTLQTESTSEETQQNTVKENEVQGLEPSVDTGRLEIADPFNIGAVEEATAAVEPMQKKGSRGRPSGRKANNATKVSREVRVAVQVTTAENAVRDLLGKLVDAEGEQPLGLVSAVLRSVDPIYTAVNWLVAESAKTDGMEIALDVSNLYASETELYKSIVDILVNMGALDSVRRPDLGKVLLPCSQAIHNMVKGDIASLQRIQEVLA